MKITWLTLVVASRSLVFAESLPKQEAPPYAIWPLPQEAVYKDERLLLRDAVIVVPEAAEARRAGRLLADLLADDFGVALPLVSGAAPEGHVPITVGEIEAPAVAEAVRRSGLDVPAKEEGYALAVGAEGAVIAGRDRQGAFYGVSSFVQLVHSWGRQSLAVRRARVRDWPQLPLRWVHLYLPGRDQLGFARRYLRDVLLRYKFNGVVLEVGGGMRLDSHPELAVGWRRTVAEWYAHGETMDKIGEGIPLGTARRMAASLHVGVAAGGYLEKDEVRGLAAFASHLGLEVVPEIQSLSHAYYIASARRDVAEDPDMTWPDSYCPSLPESYRILFDVMGEYLEVLKPRRVHIGHDEWRAGAFCSRCRGKDTGQLYAEDVLKIARWLEGKGLETWLWGDHFVDSHNRFAKKWSEGGVMRYEKPDTASARDRLVAAGAKLRIFNWSGEEGDATFRRLGWPFLIGNFEGTTQKDWAARVSRFGALGGEVSSWGAFDELELGKLQVPEALFSANLLWSARQPAKDQAMLQVGLLLPEVRGRIAYRAPPSAKADPMRFEVLDLASVFNSPPRGQGWDLSGVTSGRRFSPGAFWNAGVPFAIGDPARGDAVVVVARRPGELPTRVPLPVSGRFASLLFLHTATGEGRPAIHAGDQTHFPREASELLGFYEVVFADGLTDVHEIRYEETAAPWDVGLSKLSYFVRPVVGGRLPDGRDAVLWASEWTNRRPDVPIVSVTLVGSPGPSAALPVLVGITGVEKPRVEDYR
jgi:Glycosyl hydrolase family 20, domain 2/Glycosyl hydrolase family 20, catalytic domain